MTGASALNCTSTLKNGIIIMRLTDNGKYYINK